MTVMKAKWFSALAVSIVLLMTGFASTPKIGRSLNLGAVGNRKPRSGGFRAISVIRGPDRQRYRLKLLAAVALALVLIVAAVACFATSPSMPKTAKSFSNPWTIYTIDNNGGSFPSVEIDSDDNLHVSYAQSGGLMYATNIGGSWNTSKVADVADSGLEYNSLGLDSNGGAHISYFVFSNPFVLGYATNSGGSWTNHSIVVSSLPHIAGMFNSIGLDSKDKVHISYHDYYSWGSLEYATNANGSWETYTIIDRGRYTGMYTSLAVDSTDKIHISCYNVLEYPEYGSKLCYATNTSGAWSWYVIGDVYVDPWYASNSIAIDSNDKVHICWNSHNLVYATNANGSWEYSTIDYPTPGESYGFNAVSLALDSNNKAHVSYHEVLNYTLKYATNVNGSWEISTIDGFSSEWSSLALDSADNVYVVYAGSGGMMYATNAEPVIPEFGTAGVVVVIIATVCIFVALRRKSLPLTKE